MRTMIFMAILLSHTADTHAALVYEFVQQGTGDVIAYWELSSLPAGHEEVLSLTFTPIGETMFGLGETYAGEFDGWVQNKATDDGMGGLGDDEGNMILPSIFDLEDVPISSLAVGANETTMNLRYGNGAGEDRIWYSFDSPGSIIADGDWRLVGVPEPSTFVLAVLGLLMPWRRR